MWLIGMIDPFMSLDLVHENLTHFYNCVSFASLQPFSRGTAICLVPEHLEKVEDKNNLTMGLRIAVGLKMYLLIWGSTT